MRGRAGSSARARPHFGTPRASLASQVRWVDNVFIDRLLRSFKHEEVYLNTYENMPHARQRIRAWMDFFNQKRKRQPLKR